MPQMSQVLRGRAIGMQLASGTHLMLTLFLVKLRKIILLFKYIWIYIFEQKYSKNGNIVKNNT